MSITMAQPYVYVGDYAARPSVVEELPKDWRRLHPREFATVGAWPPQFWTNNPYLVDVFPAERVMVCTCHDGFMACTPLSEHPDWPRLSQEFKPGEFWSLVGEDWVKDLLQQ